jgi:heterotetrameric sarcosine oxidase gamma subunit
MPELLIQPAFAAPMPVPSAQPGITVRLIAPPMVSVLVRKGRAPELHEALRGHFGLGLPDGPGCVRAGKRTLLGIGPGRWLFLGLQMEELAPLRGMASLSDQGDGYAVFELWGPKLQAVLARGVPLDMRNFAEDTAAVTAIAHIGAIVWKSAPERVAIAVFRSYAGSFWHWLSVTAGEFGLSLEQSE